MTFNLPTPSNFRGLDENRPVRFYERHMPHWTQECYDRIIRDDEHLYRVVQYIGSNPAKAGLPEVHWQRWFNPEWETIGWKFDDGCSRSVECQ